jgi:hypothetical protein
MTRRLPVLILTAGILSGATAYAHHSMNAQYDIGKQIKVEGTIVQFQFRNPHSFVQVEAPDDAGQLVRWSIEWSGSAALTDQGVTRTTLKYGDKVVITGAPSRTPGDHKLIMRSLRRTSDGFGWGTKPGEVVD